ncbi:MAG: FAD-dependent oxidoreductase [Ferroplasma sp.]
MEKICVIGAGITGLFATLNLAMDGYDVTLMDRDYILSGTSGRFHGMLHSGARYSVSDSTSARECISENRLLSKNASSFIKNTGGYYLALNDEESEYGNLLISKNKENGIPTEEITTEELLKVEPNVNRMVQRAIRVPDKVIYGHAFGSAVAVESKLEGAKLKFRSEVVGAKVEENNISEIKYRYKNNIYSEKFDYVVNSTGPWSGKLLESFGIKDFEVMPTLGYMASYDNLLVNSIMSRMREPSDGDIILPYGQMSVAGTVAIISENVEDTEIDPEDLDTMISEVSQMVPSLKNYKYKKLYSSMRPLVREESSRASRDFKIYHNLDNLLTIIGGKFTTSRLMGENISKEIGKLTGVKSQNTKNIIFDNTFDKFKDKYRNMIDMDFMNYIRSYGRSMDYGYENQIESAFMLNEAIKIGE